eukprot:1855083-Rhodomonas_salina.1
MGLVSSVACDLDTGSKEDLRRPCTTGSEHRMCRSLILPPTLSDSTQRQNMGKWEADPFINVIVGSAERSVWFLLLRRVFRTCRSHGPEQAH